MLIWTAVLCQFKPILSDCDAGSYFKVNGVLYKLFDTMEDQQMSKSNSVRLLYIITEDIS